MPKFYEIIKGVKGVGEHVFTEKDIVRAKILIDIVRKYDSWKDNEGR
jgi:phosphate starvation-inducible protein PhoH